MNTVSLPYTVLILLVELAVGSLAVATVFDGRGVVTRGYVKTAAIVVFALVLLSLSVYRELGSGEEIGGYPLRPSWLAALRWSLFALLAFSALHLVTAFRSWRRAALGFGIAGTLAGVAALAALAAVIAAPTWSYAGTLGGMFAAALVLGGALMTMTWGHWYLTNSGLPKEPMEHMSLFVLGALAAQALFVLLGAVLPVSEVPLTDAAFGVTLGQNPAFWLRVGVGLVFPLALAYMAWRSSTERSMMSATGLLYIAVGAVFVGELLARGLLFATGSPV